MIDILFVDDDVPALESLQQHLADAQDTLRVRVAAGGKEALLALQAEPADVVVADLSMPEMDGAQLLRCVRDLHPRTMRVLLATPGERAQALAAMAAAHQVLVKPVAPASLRKSITRVYELQNKLHSPGVLHAISKQSSLPAVPKLYWQLAREVDGSTATSASVSAILQQDPSMTARMLQVVNSAVFSLARNITHVQDAVTYLGFEPVRSLVLAMELFRAMSALCAPQGFSLERIQNHSLRVGRIAMNLVSSADDKKTAFSAAMLHDLGKMILAMAMPEEYAVVQKHAQQHGLAEYEAESDIYGCCHAEVGAHLLALWGLPHALVEAVAFHHTPASLTDEHFGIAGAVHVADWLEHHLYTPTGVQAADDGLDHDYLRNVGVLDRLPEWLGQAQKRLAA
ncbi:MAG TPA: response regulator [Nevskiaceae bacterium]|nr:response regulator [Nevskiaceae bacterium]